MYLKVCCYLDILICVCVCACVCAHPRACVLVCVWRVVHIFTITALEQFKLVPSSRTTFFGGHSLIFIGHRFLYHFACRIR